MRLLFTLTLLLGSITYLGAGSAAPQEGSLFDRYVTKRTVTGTMIGLTTISSLDLLMRKRDELNALLHGNGPLSQRLKKDPKARAALRRSIRTLALLIATIVSALWPESTEVVKTAPTSPSIKPVSEEPVKDNPKPDDEVIRREMEQQDAAFKAALERISRIQAAKDKQAKKEKYRRALVASLSEATAQRDATAQAAQDQALRDAAEAAAAEEQRRKEAEEKAEAERNAKAAAELAAQEKALRDAAEAAAAEEHHRKEAEKKVIADHLAAAKEASEREARAAADKAALDQARREAEEKAEADRRAKEEARAAEIAAQKKERLRQEERKRKIASAKEMIAKEIKIQEKATSSLEKEINDLDKKMTEAKEEFKRLLEEPGRKSFREYLDTTDVNVASLRHVGRLSSSRYLGRDDDEDEKQKKAPRELAERYDQMRDRRASKIFERGTIIYKAIAKKIKDLEDMRKDSIDEDPNLYNDLYETLNNISNDVERNTPVTILEKHADGYGETPSIRSISDLYNHERFVSGTSKELAIALTKWRDRTRYPIP